ncbi:MAG: carbon-nitrogen hydrolase family protein [Opitutaceae bacterium]|nr:carbon-nitrogen hydrolase family protein [Opitutaceae bacterium]
MRFLRHACLFLATVAGLAAGETASAPATRIRVAAISFVPTKGDLTANADRLEQAFRQAAAGGAKLAVAPEGTLDGYLINEVLAGKTPVAETERVAVAIDDPLIRRFQALADTLDLCVVFGFAERIGGEIFNTAVFIDHAGAIRGKYHKMIFEEGYHDGWWFNRLGRQSRAFETPFGRCGILICNDRWNPELARIPALDGAQFLVIPAFGSTSPRQDDAVLSRARETDLPIVEANVGVSLVVSGGQIAAVKREREGIVFAEMTIPAPRQINAPERDATEREFLTWRAGEMQRRYRAKNHWLGRTPPTSTVGSSNPK